MKILINSFFNALNKPFISEYGSGYDRIKILVEGNADQIAAILLRRPDLNNKKLSKCLVSVDRTLKFFIQNKDFSRKPPHASTSEDFKEELTLFSTKMLDEREHLLHDGFYSGEGVDHLLQRFMVTEYLKYEEYLYDDSASDFVICPLENFIGPESTIDFGGCLRIRKITQDEFHHLVETKEKIEGEFPESYPEFILSLPLENNPTPHIELVLTALRLLRKEKVGLSKIYYGFAFPHRPWKILEAPELSKFVRNPEDSLYMFSETQNTKLIELLSLFDQNKGVGYLTIAIRRFNFAYQRENIEDSWIDYFISLESLYSKTSELTEVTHRIATRASRVLANNYDDRIKQKKKIKEWYTLRSKIVHGIKVNLDQEKLQELADCLKKSIVWFLNQKNVDHDKIIDELDLG